MPCPELRASHLAGLGSSCDGSSYRPLGETYGHQFWITLGRASSDVVGSSMVSRSFSIEHLVFASILAYLHILNPGHLNPADYSEAECSKGKKNSFCNLPRSVELVELKLTA